MQNIRFQYEKQTKGSILTLACLTFLSGHDTKNFSGCRLFIGLSQQESLTVGLTTEGTKALCQTSAV